MEQARPQYPLLSTEQIIKAGQVPNLTFLNPQQKLQYQQKVAALWEKIKNLPADDPEHVQAHRMLSDMSHQFKMRLAQERSAQQQALAGQQPMSQVQANAAAAHVQAQIQQRQLAQNMAAAQHHNTAAAATAAQRQPQFSEKVRQEVSKFNPVLPQELRSKSAEEQKRWHTQQMVQYAGHMRHWETASHQYEMFRKRATEARATMTPADIEKAKEEMGKLKTTLDAAQKAALTFKITWDPVAAAQEQQRLQAVRAAQAQRSAMAAAAAQQQSSSTQQQSLKTEEKEHATQVKSEDTDATDVKVRPPTSGQDNSSQQTTTAQQSIRPPPVPMQNPTTSSSAPPGQPTPLTHQAAIASAQRSYSQTVVPQQTPPGPAAAPAITREASSTPSASAMNNGAKATPNRPLNVAPLTPATMPPARPTMTGGQGLLGQQGQVALPKMPNVVLPTEGEGRVLSRSKLMELVREVTGGAVGDGSDALDPDVEEMLLDVADEFVDNVATAACQLAKIRGSNTLELRDVQLVIERNYNIRVPGFASDELRTVKRIIPTAAWAQKMSAIQAAKVTGGKGDA